jgi:methionyl-tRNA formyltransferase
MTQLPRVVFAGTPEFAAAALEALLAAGFAVPLVLTQPDRPAGRGMKLMPSAVKRVAVAHGIDVFQPVSLRNDPAAVARLRQTPHDVMVVAAYGLILPREVLEIPPRGCLNIHASLLPRWRGAAPIQRAIAAGDGLTGICIMRMEQGLDTGPVLLRAETAILSGDSAATLHDRLMQTGARLIVEALSRLDTLVPQPQPEAGVTYAAKIGKAEAALDFGQPAAQLARKLRAFDPFPGCTASIRGETLKLWAGEALPPTVSGPPPAGAVLQADGTGVVVACGEGALRLTELQKPGGRRQAAREFLHGFPLVPGERFGA